MRKTLLIAAIFSIASVQLASAQRIYRKTTEEGNAYPDMTLKNLVTMYTVSQSEMDRNFNIMGAIRDDFGDLGVSYTIEAKKNTKDGACFVTKKPDAVEVVFTPGENGKGIMTALKDELSAYYLKDIDSNAVYDIKYSDGYEYIILLSVSSSEEYMKIYRNSP